MRQLFTFKRQQYGKLKIAVFMTRLNNWKSLT
jgi:hypothetical protein